MKVLIRSSKKGKLIFRVVGSFRILKSIGKVVYGVKSPPSAANLKGILCINEKGNVIQMLSMWEKWHTS